MARLLINDYAGHAFPIQLSRRLAERGHDVLHTYCASVQTPRGPLARRDTDRAELEVLPITLRNEFKKYGLGTRWKQEKELGRKCRAAAERFDPDAILSANMPLVAQRELLEYSSFRGKKFVFWVQDLLGLGIRQALRRKIPLFGGLIGNYFMRLEKSLLMNSQELVLITEDFIPYVPAERREAGNVSVIRNWGPLEELPLVPKSNPWSRAQGLDDKFCLLYSGTLGMKHNPHLLVELAQGFEKFPDARVVVATEGPGADYLREKQSALGLQNLVLLPFQPFESLAPMLGTADILLAVLSEDASRFCAPSKVLAYLCAGKPLVMAMPKDNLSARIVQEHEAGIVVAPSDSPAFVQGSLDLKRDSARRAAMAKNGRNYAATAFDLETIADRFEAIIQR